MTKLLHRLFFALAPSPRERALIGLQRDEIAHPQSLVRNDRLHMTLGITNDYATFPEAVGTRMLSIGENVLAEPFTLPLDRVSGGARSVALRPSHGCSQLSTLQRQLGNGLKQWNIAREGWGFSPHVTMLYWEGQAFLRPIQPILLDVSEFILIHSIVGTTQHRELGRWTLSSAQESFAFSR